MNNKAVEHIYRLHHDWLIKCAFNFTHNLTDAEDLVQHCYEYILKMKDVNKIAYGNGFNTLYLYKIIKSKYLSDLKSPDANQQAITEDVIVTEEYDIEADNEHETKLSIIQQQLYTTASLLNWFDQKLFNVYWEENHSLTSLAQATKISRSTCWTSISRTKNLIKNKANESMHH